MNKNSTKVILLLSIVLILGLFFWGWSVLKNKNVTQKKEEPVSPQEQKISLLREQCILPQGFLINICRYSPLQRAFPVSEQQEVDIDSQKTTVSVLHFGDLDIFKINPTVLFTDDQYKDMFENIPDSVSLCFSFSPALERMRVFPSDKFRVTASDIACTYKLPVNSLNSLSFIGFISYPQEENQPQYIDIYQVPDDLRIDNIQDVRDNFFELKPLVQLYPAIIKK